MAALTFITPVTLTTTNDATWRDMDVSAYVTSASGVLLRLSYSGATSNDNCGFRKNGNTTDTYTNEAPEHYHYSYHAVGIDGSDIFEYNLQQGAGTPTLELIGYFSSADVVFFDTFVQPPSISASTWTDWDISTDTGADTAIAAIMWSRNPRSNATTMGFRANGSTDSFTSDIDQQTTRGMTIVNLDGSEIMEIYQSSTFNDPKTFCVGYIKSGWTAIDPATSINVSVIDTWEDQSVGSNTDGVFVEVVGNASAAEYGIDDDAHPEALLNETDTTFGAALVPATANTIEVRADSTSTTFYVRGYFSEAAADPFIASKTDEISNGVGPVTAAQLNGALIS